MSYFVSRQRYWPDGLNVVEVSIGGLDYANADMLTEKWPHAGEGREFTDPREAAEAAIEVCRLWRLHGCRRAKVTHVATGGMGILGEPEGYRELRRWAEAAWARIPKCAYCGGPMPEKRKGRWWSDLDQEFSLCSERCAEELDNAEQFNAAQPEEG